MSWLAGVLLVAPTPTSAQTASATSPQQEHTHSAALGSPFPPREASGTSWLPDATPMEGFHHQGAGWGVMVHGIGFAQFLAESGEAHHAGRQIGGINWLMGMAGRRGTAGRVVLRAAVSLEPWTIAGCGYLDLLATGEVCDGDSIHDRQHPHELFMELAAAYERPVGRSLHWQLYAGAAGEPALGPPAFPHRPSAFPNPIAPISHHWLDSTHITFGVITAGIVGRKWKAEGSAFNGREPDDRRADFDLAPLDSIAGRLSLSPTARLALQISAGHLREAETRVGTQPRTDVNRITASAIYHRPLDERRLWATTIAYGANSELNIIPDGVIDQTTHAVLVETSVTVDPKQTWFGRLEVVGKPADDLHAHEFITEVFTVGKLQVGYVRRHLTPWRGLRPGVGFSVTASIVPPLLAPRYGGRIAPGFGLFATIQPGPATK